MKPSEAASKMIWIIWVLTAIVIAAGFIYYRSAAAFPFALGAVLGSGLNVLKVAMLERVVGKAATMESKSAGSYVGVQYLLRFLLTGLVLVGAVFTPFISLWGVVAGILTLQIASFAVKIFFDRYEKTINENEENNENPVNQNENEENNENPVNQDEQSKDI